MNELYLAKVFVSCSGLSGATCVWAENPEEAKGKTIEFYTKENTSCEGGPYKVEEVHVEVEEARVSANNLEKEVITA